MNNKQQRTRFSKKLAAFSLTYFFYQSSQGANALHPFQRINLLRISGIRNELKTAKKYLFVLLINCYKYFGQLDEQFNIKLVKKIIKVKNPTN